MSVEIVVASPRMRRALEIAGRAAGTPSARTFLITGETGTGKDLVSRFIYEHSGGQGPFVTIDCAALPETLIESELFGHVRGAFTGATETRLGRLEAARGGTLVLDEIAALTPAAQAKLLRVLDERKFQRLGDSKPISLNARIIALTSVDLRRAVETGAFRQDLYFRLNVVSIDLPPLREQREAIGPLAALFVKRFAHADGVSSRTQLSPETLRVFETYAFPGNARELRNAIELAVISGARGRIGIEHLPDHIVHGAPAAAGHRRTLAEVEDAYVHEILRETAGNKARAARILGISRKNLYERLAKSGQ